MLNIVFFSVSLHLTLYHELHHLNSSPWFYFLRDFCFGQILWTPPLFSRNILMLLSVFCWWPFMYFVSMRPAILLKGRKVAWNDLYFVRDLQQQEPHHWVLVQSLTVKHYLDTYFQSHPTLERLSFALYQWIIILGWAHSQAKAALTWMLYTGGWNRMAPRKTHQGPQWPAVFLQCFPHSACRLEHASIVPPQVNSLKVPGP